MFLSLGNIAGRASVGMLFIDFQTPRRLRVQGTAQVREPGELLPRYPGARHLVSVTAEQVFVNCGRYIHKVGSGTLSQHVPDDGGNQPFPQWKRIDVIADSLSAEDQQRVTDAGGAIPLEDYRGEDVTAAEVGKGP